MQRRDERGLSMSTERAESVEGYERALRLLQRYRVDPLAVIDQVLAEDPQFVMGHAFRAGVFVVSTERRALPELARSVVAAEALIASGLGNERERGHTAAARAWLDGRFAEAVSRYNRLSLEHPRDMLAVQLAHLGNFYLGRSTWLRDHVAAVLPRYADSDPSSGILRGMLAFGLEECNELARAERAAERALASDPEDSWAVHALAHCYEMQGRAELGIALYESREADWAVDNFFAVHNWWHVGLFHMERGDEARVLELYDEKIRAARSEVVLDLIDASAYLWRLSLLGVSVASRFEELAATWRRVEEQGYYAFNDVHALMAYAGAGRTSDVEQALATLERSARGPGTNALFASEVGLPVARGFAAFAAGDYTRAARELFEVRSAAHRFGGSNAQRDVLEWTLLEALSRGGQHALARSLCEARVARRPESTRERRRLEQITARSSAA